MILLGRVEVVFGFPAARLAIDSSRETRVFHTHIRDAVFFELNVLKEMKCHTNENNRLS